MPDVQLVGKRMVSRLSAQAPSPMLIQPVMDAQTERAARAFLQRLEGRYRVQHGVLYGSRARRTHTVDSDADIAVVLEGKRGDRAQVGLDMAGIAMDVFDETGVLVEALPLWEDELKRPELFSNPALLETIRREGLQL